jgi:hypothetical protein
MHSERYPPSRASEPEARSEGKHDENSDPLSRERHQIPPARAHRLEVQRLQGNTHFATCLWLFEIGDKKFRRFVGTTDACC